MTRTSSLALTLLASLATLTPLAGQSPQSAGSPTTFEVASVRRFQPTPGRGTSDAISIMPGGRLVAPSATMRGLITAAHDVLDMQLADDRRILPANDRFTIEARTSPDVSVEEARTMLRALLTDRFRLAVHRETRELPVYLLTVDRNDGELGEHLRRSGTACAMPRAPSGLPAPPPPPPGPPESGSGRVLTLSAAPLRCGSLLFTSTNGAHWSMREMTIGRFAERLTATLGRPVLNRTRLDGAFDLDLTYTPDAASLDSANAPNAPSLMTALREQLGLRLASSREQVEVLVIDRVEPPTEN